MALQRRKEGRLASSMSSKSPAMDGVSALKHKPLEEELIREQSEDSLLSNLFRSHARPA